jgi:molybdate transport system ATP-binding protein
MALELSLLCPGDDDFSLQLNCQLADRGVTAICGPSGSGKSTLLDCIAGLRRPAHGSVVRYRGESWQEDDHFTPPWLRQVGYVFQDARLFPHLTVQGNLDFARQRAPRDGAPDPSQVSAWLDLEPLLSRQPGKLSAGQRQRVAIGRAVLANPRLLLLDEPLANLDRSAGRQCLDYLQRLARAMSLPMLYVSHDIEEVAQLADRLLLLRQGQVVEQGPLIELCSRLDTSIAHEEQAAAIVVGTVAAHDTTFGLTEISLEGQSLYVNHLPEQAGAERRVRIPARDVSICRQRPSDSSILNILSVTLEEIEQTAHARVLLRLALGEQHLLARITRKSASQLGLQAGDRLYAQIKSAALLSEGLHPP